jgi:hypothetical protein
VSEVDTALQELSCGDDGHGRVPSLPAYASRRPTVVQHRTLRRCLMLARHALDLMSRLVETECAARTEGRYASMRSQT